MYQLSKRLPCNTGNKCDGSGTRSQTGAGSLPHSGAELKGAVVAWDVNLFPNPNNGNFMIISKNDNEILEVTINDVSGKELYSKKIQTSKHYYVLDLALMNGVYFVTIRNNKNESVTKKMGITK